jgi:hypothetical protein
MLLAAGCSTYVAYPTEVQDANEIEGSYKDGLIGKLSMKVSEYYKSALAAANSTDFPSAGFFPPVSSFRYQDNGGPDR